MGVEWSVSGRHRRGCLIIIGYIQVVLDERLQLVANVELFRLLGGAVLPFCPEASLNVTMVTSGISSSKIRRASPCLSWAPASTEFCGWFQQLLTTFSLQACQKKGTSKKQHNLGFLFIMVFYVFCWHNRTCWLWAFSLPLLVSKSKRERF